jgi:predicted AlkP superfamily pyrophosphatase or phosphodiesterase
VVVGDVDTLSHYHGQEAALTQQRLAEIDGVIGAIVRRADELGACLVVISDHGHLDIRARVDPYAELGIDLRRYCHVIDDVFLRIWTERPGETAELAARLDDHPHLKVLGDPVLEAQGVAFPDRRYGDLIALLDPHVMFARTSWGALSYISTHGYHPDAEGYAGLFRSNWKFEARGPVEQIDVTPTLLEVMGLPLPPHLDGAPLTLRPTG